MRMKPFAVSAAALAMFGLAGCHASHSWSSKPTPSSSSTGSASGKSGDVSGALELAFSKTMDAKTAKVSMVLKTDTNGTATTINGDGLVQFNPMAEQLTMRVGGQQIQTIMVDGVEYVQVGGNWQKVNISQLTGGSSQGADPTQMLSYLQGVSSSVTSTGTTTIRGSQATGYQATIDLDKVAAKENSDQQQATKKAEQALGTSSVPIEVWLDGQGRLVREHVAMTVTAAGHKVSTDTTIDMYDYGTPVSIKAPQ
jgi:hypothetical protein